LLYDITKEMNPNRTLRFFSYISLMDRFDGRLVKIEVNMEKVGDTLDEIRSDIRDKADKKDLIVLESRVAKLEHS
jgi:hypothetical protein